ncbi:MAG: hypothetical protein WCA63_00850 [Gallionella sp.]
MNIRNLVLIGILAIIGGAAFVYFDPLELDLLGLKKGAAVAKPAVPPLVAAPSVQPTAAPKTAPVPAQSQAPVAAPPPVPAPTAAPKVSAAQPPVVAPKAVAAPSQPSAPAATPATPSATAAPAANPATTLSSAAPDQALEPPLKLSKSIKIAMKPSQSGQTANKPQRAKNLDLRHCLELETDAAIAKCAGE